MSIDGKDNHLLHLSTQYSIKIENYLKSGLARYVQCNLDLVTSYLVTNPDLVTILQKTIFLVHKKSHLVTI